MSVASPETVQSALTDPGTLSSIGTRRALAGFFLSGVMLSFLGAILPSWKHHLSSDYLTVGLYFLGLIAGLLSAVGAAPRLLEKKGLSWTLSFSCAIAGTAFLYLAMVSPPWDPWWRIGGMAIVGFAAGLLHTAIFEAISPMYRHAPAATVNVAGMLFGLGCLTVALLISGIYYIYTPAAIQVWIAVVPALAGWGYWKTEFAPVSLDPTPAARQILVELRSPAAVLLSLILFFQLGNEWAIAGWLPLFLSQRLGISPETSLLMLALYWLSLLIGRAASQWILPRVRHSRILVASVIAAIFGCVILLQTDNRFGALTGILLLGAAFAPIYPLLVEKIGKRFPGYHPGHYNGIFSVAMACGLLAPSTLGYFASMWGVGVVMDLPLAGSIVVFVLLVLLWVEARFQEASTRAASSKTPIHAA
jgi:FHS family glucose/mannose:H+ symporter-like MFS transporter